MTDGREVEIKFQIEAGGTLDDLPVIGGAIGRARHRRLHSVYYDTPDRDLHRAGFVLRLREDGSGIVQGAKQEGASGIERGEWERPVKASELDFGALGGTPIDGLLSRTKVRKALGPVFEVDVERRSGTISRGRAKMEFAIDFGEIRAAGRCVPVAEIEIELLRGRRADLLAVAGEIGNAPALIVSLVGKADRGYLLARDDWPAPTKKTPALLNPDMSTADAISAICRACLRQFMLNRPAFALPDAKVEAVHQSRVAIRRLRAALGFFKSVVAGPEFTRLRVELKWLAAALGEARDLDVQAEMAATATAEISAATDPLVAGLDEKRAAAHARLAQSLASPRLRRLMLDLVLWLEDGAWRRSRVPERVRVRHLPAGDFAAHRLKKWHRRLAHCAADIAALDPTAMHQVRILAKKLRYAAEFFEPLATSAQASSRYEHLAEALEDLQNELGAIHDQEAQSDYLRTEMLAATAQGQAPDDSPLSPATERLIADRPDRDAAVQRAVDCARRIIDAKPFWTKFDRA